MTEHVKIGPEFFQNAFNDYSNRHWAFAREVLQNAIDSGAKNIEVTVAEHGDGTLVEVTDDGCGMDRETITEKLLSLGGTGKAFKDGAVGGFGKAKEILFFAHKSYSIHSRDILVRGAGGQYNIDQAIERRGTKVSVLWNGARAHYLNESFSRFCRYASWSGIMTINGDRTATDLRPGTFKKDLTFASVYATTKLKSTVLVRVHGIPMFNRYTSNNTSVVLELTKPVPEVMSSNRDHFKMEQSLEFDALISAMEVNKKSALRQVRVEYTRYAGDKLRNRVTGTYEETPTPVMVEILRYLSETTGDGGRSRDYEEVAAFSSESVSSRTDVRKSRLGHEFILKNTTGMEIPDYFKPDSTQFGQYQKGIAKMWAACLMELHQLFEKEGAFSIGFILDEENEAEYEKSTDYGTVFYLNPATVVRQEASSSRSFKKRFKLTERHRVLAIALHEFIHAEGLLQHDEDYSNRLTGRLGVVMANLKRFNKCFK